MVDFPADHPQAWRCYNQRTVLRCAKCLGRRGVLMLRTQAGPGGFHAAMAAARAFRNAVVEAKGAVGNPAAAGETCFVAEVRDGCLDMLLVNSPGAMVAPGRYEGLFVVPLEQLLAELPEGAPVRLMEPPCLWRGRLEPRRLLAALERLCGSAEATASPATDPAAGQGQR